MRRPSRLGQPWERHWWSIDFLGPGPKADPWIPKGRWATGQFGQKSQKKVKKPKEAEMEVDEAALHEAGAETRSLKRKVIRAESEETQDYVRETISQEEAEEVGFVPSALGEPRGATDWCDNR